MWRIVLGSRSPHVICLEFWRARTTLMRRTLLDNTSRWTLSFPSFYLVLGALGEFDGVLWSQFSRFTWNRFVRTRILRYPTQLYGILYYRNWSFRTTFFDFLLGFASASTCRKWHLSPNTHFSDLWLRHTGRCQNPHDGFLHRPNRYGISLVCRVFLFIAWPLWGFLLLAVSPFCLRMGCGRRRSPFPSLSTALISRG